MQHSPNFLCDIIDGGLVNACWARYLGKEEENDKQTLFTFELISLEANGMQHATHSRVPLHHFHSNDDGSSRLRDPERFEGWSHGGQ